MAQTYCVRADIEEIIGVAGVFACIDDNQDGIEDVEDTGHITSAIERGAMEINAAIRHQYVLSQCASNAWCKYANAELACYYLRIRRNNPAEQSHNDSVTEIRRMLVEMRWGRDQLPEQAPSFEHIPTVSNLKPELWKIDNPIRVVKEESTGAAPEGNRKRNVANQHGSF